MMTVLQKVLKQQELLKTVVAEIQNRKELYLMQRQKMVNQLKAQVLQQTVVHLKVPQVTCKFLKVNQDVIILVTSNQKRNV